MLVFGHAGITLGAAILASSVANSRGVQVTEKRNILSSLPGYLDIRLLLIGSLLPDIIDKPVGQLIFRETFSNGRIFSHTLLFLLIISAAGLYLYKSRKQYWLLTLAAGTFTHLLLDRIWITPRTLFWPFMGLTFDRIELENWAASLWEALSSNPGVFVPEIIGIIIVILFAVTLIYRKRLTKFIMYGRTD